MGGTEPWLETDVEYMQREYRMRCIEAIVGDDGICAEEIDGIFVMTDRIANYVMTGEHNIPGVVPTFKPVEEMSVGGLRVRMKGPDHGHEPGPKCGPECEQP
jgi:hypothetical protein